MAFSPQDLAAIQAGQSDLLQNQSTISGLTGMLQTLEKIITIRFLQHGYNVILSGVSKEPDGMHAFESPSNLITFIDRLVKQER